MAVFITILIAILVLVVPVWAMVYTSKEVAARRQIEADEAKNTNIQTDTPPENTPEIADENEVKVVTTKEVLSEKSNIETVTYAQNTAPVKNDILSSDTDNDKSNTERNKQMGQSANPIDIKSILLSIEEWLNGNLQLLGLQDKGLKLVGALFLVAWIGSGIYNVQPDEQGVVVRFGQWIETNNPGLHYHLPFPVETVMFPKVTKINQLKLGDPYSSSQDSNNSHSQMLTGDENIVEAECTVFWKIKNAEQFLFKINNPESAIKVTAESALREVISRTPIQAAMSDKRQQIADQTRELLQNLLDKEKSGIYITQVQLQRVDPPAAVIDAFNDVQRARADQERERNEAEAYANDIIPRARGEAAKIIQDAQAYSNQVVSLADGDAKGFLSLYESYKNAKAVTAWRLYLDSIDEVLKKSAKVIIDTSGKGVSSIVPYMPISDKDKNTPKEKLPSKEVAK